MLRLIVLTAVTSSLRAEFSTVTTVASAMRAADFEVFGRVQGVFFRKYTKQEADKLGIRGWCMNTTQGTVQGHIQGPSDKLEAMMTWLKTTGSPSSKIEKVEFHKQRDITEYTFDNFSIRKG